MESRVNLQEILAEMYELEKVQGKKVKQVFVSKEALEKSWTKEFKGNRERPVPLLSEKGLKGQEFRIETYDK